MKRKCKRCKVLKPLRDFDISRRNRLGRHLRCKACRRIKRLKRKLGVNGKEIEKIISTGMCSICGEKSKKKLHLDHCHKTLKIRGLLCCRCNMGLGYFLDDPKLLQSAISYLERSQ